MDGVAAYGATSNVLAGGQSMSIVNGAVTVTTLSTGVRPASSSSAMCCSSRARRITRSCQILARSRFAPRRSVHTGPKCADAGRSTRANVLIRHAARRASRVPVGRAATSIVCAAVVGALTTASGGSPPDMHRAPVPGIRKIRHVVVIMQENRSFDNYFGTYPGADGIPMKNGVPTVCLPDVRPRPCVRPYPDHADVNTDSPHASAVATTRHRRRPHGRIRAARASRSAELHRREDRQVRGARERGDD